jgi:hypothetical protein
VFNNQDDKRSFGPQKKQEVQQLAAGPPVQNGESARSPHAVRLQSQGRFIILVRLNITLVKVKGVSTLFKHRFGPEKKGTVKGRKKGY